MLNAAKVEQAKLVCHAAAVVAAVVQGQLGRVVQRQFLEGAILGAHFYVSKLFALQARVVRIHYFGQQKVTKLFAFNKQWILGQWWAE